MSSSARWFRQFTLGLGALLLALGLVCLINGSRKISEPFPGFLIADNLVVLSVARPQWPVAHNQRMFFSEVFDMDDAAVTDAASIQEHAASLPLGSPISYRVRRGADIAVESIRTLLFAFTDFLAIYGAYFLVGLFYLSAAVWIGGRRSVSAARVGFCVFCLAVSGTLFLGADFYGPYWFTSLYLLAHSATPAALLHLAASYPEPIGPRSVWRRLFLAVLYAFSLGIGVAMIAAFDDPSVFLPLLYTVYLLLANALLLYVARLAVAYWSTTDADSRRSIGYALSGVVLAGTVAGVIFVVYPSLENAVSPLALVLPLALFPWPTALAVRYARDPARRIVSIRSRLSLLLLVAVETTFLVGVGMFWLNDSWQRLLDDLTLNRRQQSALQHLLASRDENLRPQLRVVAESARTVEEHTLAAAATRALRSGDDAAVDHLARQLLERYEAAERQLEGRKRWLVHVSSSLVIVLVFVGLFQATGFMLVVRRWFIGPMAQLSEATAVIATGDLSHRVGGVQTAEFSALADAIDRMAESLAEIQRKIDAEREARRNAAGVARDLERRRLARELHDGALQDLTAFKYGLEGELKSRGSADLQHLMTGATRCMKELRAIVDDLRAPDLANEELADAIRLHARSLTHQKPIELALDLSETAAIADWAAHDVYRVAQEAIANAVRHAAPTHIVVRLVELPGSIILEVRDDGRGFDPDAVYPGKGLIGMRERAAALGAHLQIESGPGRGTVVRLQLQQSRGDSLA
jgi:signal transduction histidine kinase